jgi:hypothetical protein
LFGLVSCKSGKRGPKKNNEVILGVGNSGLRKTEKSIDNFWNIINKTVNKKYNLKTLESFSDKKVLSFDARRVNWEELLPLIGEIPGRLYVPRGLSDKNLETLDERFNTLGFSLLAGEYYDSDFPGHFFQYNNL